MVVVVVVVVVVIAVIAVIAIVGGVSNCSLHIGHALGADYVVVRCP